MRPPLCRFTLTAVAPIRSGKAALLLLAALDASAQPSAVVQSLIGRMSLDEKIALVHGVRDPRELGQAGYWPGLPRLGVPPLRFADGPPGVNANRDATSMPAPVGLAATFDPAAAYVFGLVLGREARALEQNVLLAPHVDIVRDPLFRRNHTALTEDPLLAARMAAAEITGIQSQGVMAQVKHLAAYNGSDNVRVDERTLQEIYLPPFEAAVRAGVASVMCAYNQVNGVWACENPTLQNDILRRQWGFQGFVTSDWGATHRPAAIQNGLDLEMPGREIAGRRGGPYFTEALKSAIEDGTIPIATLDRAVIRILDRMEAFSLLGQKSASSPARIAVEVDAKIARRIATESAVLLKNAGDLLPLTPGDLDSVVLIGPTAGQLAAGFMGERAFGFESRLISPLAALRSTAPRARIAWEVGVDLTGTEMPIAYSGAALRPGEHSWRGMLDVPEDGDYTFLVQPTLSNGSEGGGAIVIDGRPAARTGGPGFGGTGMIARKWSSLIPTRDGRDNGRGNSIRLARGPHRVEISAHSIGDGPLNIRFSWITPASRRSGIESAVAAARKARTAVVFAWNGGSGLSLSEDQDRLIEEVAAANARTIVVLNTGGAVAMLWREKVKAILEMWYPGQEGGWATADLLLGRTSPGGKLPVTFPRNLDDAPARAPGHPERLAAAATPGTSGTDLNAPETTFSEGIAVGYRWYDQQNIEPLFPFGHGLSYTRFEYSDLTVRRTAVGFELAITLRNAGSREGAEVAQVYVGPPADPPVFMVPKSLVGFQRVNLSAGRNVRVKIPIEKRQLSYWSEIRHDWVLVVGDRPFYVGSSSRDIRLTGTLRVTEHRPQESVADRRSR
jgi:beta-glucosidase